jgi:hypothetical protein
MTTYKDIIEKYNLGLELTKIPFRPDRASDEWDKKASHYAFKIYVKYGDNFGKEVKGFYSMGSALKHKPTLEEILNSLSLDTISLEGFEYWASDYGYDTDSRKAFAIYQECEQLHKQLVALLGNKGLEELHECEQL